MPNSLPTVWNLIKKKKNRFQIQSLSYWGGGGPTTLIPGISNMRNIISRYVYQSSSFKNEKIKMLSPRKRYANGPHVSFNRIGKKMKSSPNNATHQNWGTWRPKQAYGSWEIHRRTAGCVVKVKWVNDGFFKNLKERLHKDKARRECVPNTSKNDYITSRSPTPSSNGNS